ncbi:MAG TPA: peptide chain release factor N(5)-glutamine methyltransferase [Chloroflexota bacterium]
MTDLPAYATAARSSLTVAEGMAYGRRALAASRTASLDTQLLLGHVLRRGRSWVLAHDDEELDESTAATFRALIERRAAGEPVAHLRGFVEWYGMHIEVGPQVLVPRPETELLAEEATRVATARGVQSIADIGTGSGAIAIALARELPDVGIFAADVSHEALMMARKNAAALGCEDRISWLRGNLLTPLSQRPDLIVANLPYLSNEMMGQLDADVRHEPAGALYGGPTGIELYEELFRQRETRKWNAPVLAEIDPRQAAAMSGLLRDRSHESLVRIEPDYAGLPRIVVVGA